MSEIVTTSSLTTKYRPRVLDDLYGQDHLVVKLKGMLKKKQVPSVFLISGRSGCGKTTISEIINRYVNCETLDACGECDSCKKLKHPDLAVFNVGDTRGIDDIRSIIQGAKIMPRYKKRVMLLDEVHALTPQASTALLVPLENPSPNTIWLLSTTNPEKLLPTIVGRCHRLDIRSIEPEAIRDRLFEIAKLEGVNLKKIEGGMEALEYLVSLSNGQMRDAIQMLESLLFAIYSEEKLDAKTLLKKFVVGTTVELDKLAASLLANIMDQNLNAAVKDVLMTQEVRGLVSKMRWLIHAKMQDSCGLLQYQPNALKIFEKIVVKRQVNLKYRDFILIQSVLTKAEISMNSCSIDPQILLMSAIGDYVNEILNRKRGSSD